MTTSNSYNFSVTRDDIIKAAYQHVNLVGEGETPSTAQITEAALILNMLVKLRAADGMPLWALKRGYLLPFTGESFLATDSHVVTAYDATTMNATGATNDVNLTVSSTTGMVIGDQIGIELSDSTMQWSQVSLVNSSTSVTISPGLTGATVAGSRVYTYAVSDRIQKPLRILEADIKLQSDGTSHGIFIEDRGDYFNLGNRAATGIPNMIYYDQVSTNATNLDNGLIFVFPRFSSGDYVIEFTYHRPFQDFDSSADNPDFPQAFYLPLMLELAFLLSPKASLPIEERRSLMTEAKMYREEALSTVAPEGSMSLQPERSR